MGYNCNMKKERLVQRNDANAIKKALIDWLDAKYEDKTITTEISVNTSYGVRVADVVLANGHTVAFEIKSEHDTLKRLESQILGYSEVFDYVYVVYWRGKFLIDTASVPERVGIIEAFRKNGKISFRKLKSAYINKERNPVSAANFLWKSELLYMLWKKGIHASKRLDKQALVEKFLKAYGKRERRMTMRFIMKHRFSKGYNEYLSSGSLDSYKKSKVDINYIHDIWAKEFNAQESI